MSAQRMALAQRQMSSQTKKGGGWITRAAMNEIARILDVSERKVYEVATFYTMYNLAPVGEHFVQLCGTTPCWLRGANDLKDVMRRRVGEQNVVSPDGKLSWLEVECLGACANAPMVQISNAAGDHYYEDLTPETFDALLDKLVAGEQPEPGPQSDRHGSEPTAEGSTVLRDYKVLTKRKKLTKLPNQDKKVEVRAHAGDPKGRRATVAGRRNKPAEPASAKPAPKVDHERSVELKTRKKDAGKMAAPAVKSAKITKRKPVKDAKGNPTPDPKGTAVAAKRRTSSAVPQVLYTDGPTDGSPDDLKVIKGIGPKFESDLNGKGIYYYRQIGAWKAADIKTVEADAMARFPGRIKRDGWVAQAKALAKKHG